MNKRSEAILRNGEPFPGDIEVRLITAQERRRWDQLMVRHHYLRNGQMVGQCLRYVAVRKGQWLALVGWSSGAYHLRVRDRFIGWTSQQRQVRLPLVVNNARFLVLPGVGLANLASHVLAQTTARLSADWQTFHGHGVLLAETFVDGQLYQGTCYRAAGWQRLGASKGFGRRSRDYYLAHERPKELFIKPLHRRALDWLKAQHLPSPWDQGLPAATLKPSLRLAQWQSLYELFGDLPDFRSPHGRLHKVPTVVSIAAAAVLAGARGYLAVAEYAARLTQRQLAAVRAYWNPKTQRYQAPGLNAIWRVLTHLDAEALDQRIGQWFGQLSPQLQALAVDGKTLRSTGTVQGKPVHLLSAFSHQDHTTLAQALVSEKENEIPALPQLLGPLPLDDVVVTADALHTQRDTARFLVTQKGADYLLVVKDNQPTLHRHLQRLLPQSAFSPSTHPGR